MSAAERRKRKGKGQRGERQDFALRQVQARARTAQQQPKRPDPTGPAASPSQGMAYPVMCKWCRTIHDGGAVTIEVRYTDCSGWRCPSCDVLIDDRPIRLGGSAIPVKVVEPERIRRGPKLLPWEDQPDDYDLGIDRLMREAPGGR